MAEEYLKDLFKHLSNDEIVARESLIYSPLNECDQSLPVNP
jgi:hypothetical protein